MAGTRIGGQNAARTNKKRYGKNFYSRIGQKGGKIGRTGGFYQNRPCDCDEFEDSHTVPMCAGAKGGRESRRGK